MRKTFIALLFVFLLLACNLVAQDVNKFRVRVRTVLSGTEEYQLAKAADGYHLTGKSHMQQGARTIDMTHEQTLAPDLTLVRYKLQVGNGEQVIEAWRDGHNIQIKVSAGGQQPTKTVPFAPAMLVLDNLVTAHFQVLLDRMAASSPPLSSFTAVVPQVMAAIPAKVTAAGEEAATLDGNPIRAQKYTLQVANSLTEFWAEAGTHRLMRIYVPLQDVEQVREGFALAPKPEPKKEGAAAFVERNLEFPSADLKVPATLCLPANVTGKVPIVIFVHGSGSQAGDRDETIGPNKPFRDLAHGLAAAGIGTLRYEKRTYAFKTKIDRKTFTVEDETIHDAVAAMQFARTLPEIDPARVFVLGHSQGAMFAPTIAERAQGRGAIMMAAAERPLDQVIPEQTAFQMKLVGRSDQEIAAEVDGLKKAFARVRSGEAQDDEVVFNAPAHYWRDFLKRDPLADLKNLKAPVLLLQGGKDVQVLKADYDLALQALAAKPPEMREAHFFPELNHLFIPVQGQPTGAEYGLAGHIPPEVIQTIATWVNKQGAAK
jgi:hypothetical protein